MGTKKVKQNTQVADICHDYSMYRVTNIDEQIDQIAVESLNQEEFYAKYIKPRKPVKFSNCIDEVNIEDFKIDKLVDTLGFKGDLKVEKRYKGGFGTNLERAKMSLEELVEKFESDDAGYYLTTQYEDEDEEIEDEEESENGGYVDEGKSDGDNSEEDRENEENESDQAEPLVQPDDGDESDSSFGSLDMDNLQDDFEESQDEMDESEVRGRIRQLFQPPLTHLYNKLPLTPSLFSMLIPQQINIWMGYSKSSQPPADLGDLSSKFIPGAGSSSGLHHDHADNLYLLVSGTKRFSLFSPYDADKLATVGTIYKVYNSGVIDYERDENAPSWHHVRDDGAMVRDVARWQLSRDDIDPEAKKELLAVVNEQAKTYDHKPSNPPSFSNIPPVLLHLDELDAEERRKLVCFSNEHFPGFLDTPRLTVWLKPGEMLYLPTGWFHEVSSFGCDTPNENKDNVHIALNYWFIPSNGDSLRKVYRDSYWEEDFQKSKHAIDLATNDFVSLDERNYPKPFD